MFARPRIDDAKKDAVELTDFYPGFRTGLSGSFDISSIGRHVARMFTCVPGGASEENSAESYLRMDLDALRYLAGFLESHPETWSSMASWSSKETEKPIVRRLVSEHDDFSDIPSRSKAQVASEAAQTEYDEEDFAEFHLKMKPKHYVKSAVPLRFRGERRPPELPL